MNFKRTDNRAFWRDALKLAVPIALQNLLASSFHLVDTIMIGGLGEVPLAAVGMAGQWSWLMGVVLFGFTSGASVFFAQYWGAKDTGGIKSAFGILFISTVLAAFAFFGLAQIAPDVVLGAFSSDPEVIAQGSSYLRYASYSYLATAVNFSFAALLRSTEHAKLPLYGSLVSVLLNIVFNALFIFGLNMGVAGAGLATSVSAFAGPLIVLALSTRPGNMLLPCLRGIFKRETGFTRRFFKTSLPVLVNEALWALGTVSFSAVYGNLDTQFYAALTIFKSVEGLCFVFFTGLCHACAVMVGKSVGKGDMRTAMEEARRFAVAMVSISVVVGLALIAARPLILPVFDVGHETRTAAERIMLFYGLEIGLRNIPYVMIVGVFRAGGDTRTGLKYDIGFLWLVSLPVTCFCAFVLKLPLTWIYLIMLLSEDFGKAILCVRWFITRKWLMPVTGSGQTAPVGED